MTSLWRNAMKDLRVALTQRYPVAINNICQPISEFSVPGHRNHFASECCGGPSQSHLVPKFFIGFSWTGQKFAAPGPPSRGRYELIGPIGKGASSERDCSDACAEGGNDSIRTFILRLNRSAMSCAVEASSFLSFPSSAMHRMLTSARVKFISGSLIDHPFSNAHLPHLYTRHVFGSWLASETRLSRSDGSMYRGFLGSGNSACRNDTSLVPGCFSVCCSVRSLTASLTRETTKSCKVIRRLAASFLAFQAKSSGIFRRFHVAMISNVAEVCAVVNVGFSRNNA
jgi:hypothetical protein